MRWSILVLVVLIPFVFALENECANPHEAWIWCDDFEEDRLESYFEYVDRDGAFTRQPGVGVDGSYGMQVVFEQGAVDVGNLKLAVGAQPSTYFRPVDDGIENYTELYWRMYLRHQDGWVGGGAAKLSRATTILSPGWAQGILAHVFSMGCQDTGLDACLGLDPASGIGADGTVRSTRYNDWPNLRWLGAQAGTKPLFSSEHVGEWFCIEAYARLNDPGQSNGVFRLWINDELDAEGTGINWVGNYQGYGINNIFFENYWNDGSPTRQERYFDNIVVSTERIGCETPSEAQEPEAPHRPEGDVTGDGQVGLADLLAVVSVLGRSVGEPGVNAFADQNGDGVIDLFDVVIVARNIGRTAG